MLMAPPFGLPTSVIPIFTAVAIRQAVSRLKWANRSEPFESSLWDASCIGTDLKLRFDNFKPKQLQVLDALRRAMRLPLSDTTDAEDQARETLSKLRSYYKELPDAVRHSSKLSLERASSSRRSSGQGWMRRTWRKRSLRRCAARRISTRWLRFCKASSMRWR